MIFKSERLLRMELLEPRTLLAADCLGADHCSVSGHVELDINLNIPRVGFIEVERYSFNAVRHKDGRVTGEWQVIDVTTGKNELIHGDVTCFRIDPDGKTVYLGGVIERENILGLPPGSEANWTVVDNGEGKKADTDLATDLTFGFNPGSGRASRHCATGRGFTNFPTTPINNGNIQVKVKAFRAGLGGLAASDDQHETPTLVPRTISVSGASDLQFRRIEAAVTALNHALPTPALSLVDNSAQSADIRISHATASGCGGQGAGVLGCAHANGDITVVDGWDYYDGADSQDIGANQFDYQTVIMHELGHAIGLSHDTSLFGFMASSLAPGTALRQTIEGSASHESHQLESSQAFFDFAELARRDDEFGGTMDERQLWESEGGLTSALEIDSESIYFKPALVAPTDRRIQDESDELDGDEQTLAELLDVIAQDPARNYIRR